MQLALERCWIQVDIRCFEKKNLYYPDLIIGEHLLLPDPPAQISDIVVKSEQLVVNSFLLDSTGVLVLFCGPRVPPT